MGTYWIVLPAFWQARDPFARVWDTALQGKTHLPTYDNSVDSSQEIFIHLPFWNTLIKDAINQTETRTKKFMLLNNNVTKKGI